MCFSASFCVFHDYIGFDCIYVMFRVFFSPLTNSVMSILRDKFEGIFWDKGMSI